ncbi:hypothetical protein [Thalassorhabdomicrobium marinisediminis]|uniref:hypothetical protein n=1 Tax=Thalassorhabdomicrobium marinisediminis TaxID=2170577 RepID=UPI002492367E|nr:hypothetical protein [Thalassorhabdomicrobium marinisediminis]
MSAIVFTPQGAMILAQRGSWEARRDYGRTVADTKAEVLRYVYESPEDNPETPSVWFEDPTVLPVGFEEGSRNGLGGIDLGPGYDARGRFDWRSCSGTLWTTGQDLRVNADLSETLTAGGRFEVDGVQGVPRLYPVAQNTPPWFSYFVNFDGTQPEAGDDVSGRIGDVEVLGCHGERTGEEQIVSAADVDVPEQYDLPPEAELPDNWCAQGSVNAGVCFCALFPVACFPSSDPSALCADRG